jgi:hypothetical protein
MNEKEKTLVHLHTHTSNHKQEKKKEERRKPAVVKGAEETRVRPGVVRWMKGIISMKARLELVCGTTGNKGTRGQRKCNSETQKLRIHPLSSSTQMSKT